MLFFLSIHLGEIMLFNIIVLLGISESQDDTFYLLSHHRPIHLCEVSCLRLPLSHVSPMLGCGQWLLLAPTLPAIQRWFLLVQPHPSSLSGTLLSFPCSLLIHSSAPSPLASLLTSFHPFHIVSISWKDHLRLEDCLQHFFLMVV